MGLCHVLFAGLLLTEAWGVSGQEETDSSSNTATTSASGSGFVVLEPTEAPVVDDSPASDAAAIDSDSGLSISLVEVLAVVLAGTVIIAGTAWWCIRRCRQQSALQRASAVKKSRSVGVGGDTEDGTSNNNCQSGNAGRESEDTAMDFMCGGGNSEQGYQNRGSMSSVSSKLTPSKDSAAASSFPVSSVVGSLLGKSTVHGTDDTQPPPFYDDLRTPDSGETPRCATPVKITRDGNDLSRESPVSENLPRYATPAKLPQGALPARTPVESSRTIGIPPPKYETPAKILRDAKPSTPEEWQMSEGWRHYMIPGALSGTCSEQEEVPDEGARTAVIPRSEYVAPGKGFRRGSDRSVPVTETPTLSPDHGSASKRSEHEDFESTISPDEPQLSAERHSRAAGAIAPIAITPRRRSPVDAGFQETPDTPAQHSTPSKIWRGVMECAEIEDILEATTTREPPRYSTPEIDAHGGDQIGPEGRAQEMAGTTLLAGISLDVAGMRTVRKRPAYVVPKLETVLSGLEVPTPSEEAGQFSRPFSLPRSVVSAGQWQSKADGATSRPSCEPASTPERPTRGSALHNSSGTPDEINDEALPGYVTPLKLPRERRGRERAGKNPWMGVDKYPHSAAASAAAAAATAAAQHAAVAVSCAGLAGAETSDSGDTPPPVYATPARGFSTAGSSSRRSKAEELPKYVTPDRFKPHARRVCVVGDGVEERTQAVSKKPRALQQQHQLCDCCKQKLKQ